ARAPDGRSAVRRLVAHADAGGPRVVCLAPGRRVPGAAPFLLLAPEAATSVGLHAPLHLRGGVLQRRADLVDLEFHHGSLLPFTGLEGPLHEPALGDDAHALLERFGHVLGCLAPDGAAEEERVTILPLLRLA